MIRLTRFLLIFLLLAGVSGCGPVKFVSTWKNPEAQPQNWEGEKIAAFVITLMKATRLGAETTLARELTQRGAQGIAGHTLVTLEMARKDPDRAREILESEGVNSAVVMRVVGQNYEVSYSPGSAYYVGTYYTGFWGYWNYGVATVYTPGHTTAEEVVSIETRLYSVKDDLLLWAGTSKTTNPENVQKFVYQLVEAVGKEVRKSGLVAR